MAKVSFLYTDSTWIHVEFEMRRYLFAILCILIAYCSILLYTTDWNNDTMTRFDLDKLQTIMKSSLQDSVKGPNANNNLRRKVQRLTLKEVPNMTVAEVDCHGLFTGRKMAVRQAEELQNITHLTMTDHKVIKLAKDCSSYRNTRGYILRPVSLEEYNFPLAFSIVVFKDAHLVERLLRTIYRPQNYYCIHVDQKANVYFRKAILSVAACFGNVFVPNISVNVTWGAISVLEAEMVCLRELWKYKSWKYFINLSGQEFPLKTNLEIVKIVKTFNGANDARGSIDRRWWGRWTKALKVAPPGGERLRLGKGQVQVILSRAFVNYTLHDKVALDFYEWLNGTIIPDESYFNSLNISPLLNVPGAYTGRLNTNHPDVTSVARLKYWSNRIHQCAGKTAHHICILNIYHLPELATSKHLFANKFHSGYHPLAYSCMEQLIAERVRAEVIMGKSSIDLRYYRKLPFVLHHRN